MLSYFIGITKAVLICAIIVLLYFKVGIVVFDVIFLIVLYSYIISEVIKYQAKKKN